MDDRNFDAQLADVLEHLDGIPPADRDRINRLASATRARHEHMRKTLADLQDSLDHLRLSVKYLVFDLEATRRENQYLRRLIESQGDKADGREDR
ncbi:MAG TPA: hypothetical protein VFF69_01080 [Phycisphaerales bacterium]|nr:hypothetical protein [Phycisphaerales bacterium]